MNFRVSHRHCINTKKGLGMPQDWNRYGPTAARPPGATPGRAMRPQSITIDIHSHIAIPQAAEFVKPHLDPATIPLINFATPQTKALNARQDSDRRGLMTGHEERLADLDAMGIDLQLVMCPPPQCYYTVPLNTAVKAARIINDGVAAYVAARPDRFVALGTVPMPDGNEAARELERCMTQLGFKGVQILTNVAGKELSDPVFTPFWRKAEELGAVVLIHPNGFTEARRFSRFYFNNVIGNPLETTIALHCLIFDGVLERHPDLKIIAVHGGGFLGAYPGRIDHAWGARGDARGDLPKPPSTYLKKIYVDTVVFTPEQLTALVATFGIDHVLMGTDYPYDMAEYEPLQHLAATRSLDDAARAAIAGGNAKRLLGV
jgi:aminocarboxymuconate-semialdehyde decarboxylase